MPFDPDKFLVDEGNSSRKATPEELYDRYGLLKCKSLNCEEERKELGLEEEPLEELIPAHTTTGSHMKFVATTRGPLVGSKPTQSLPTPTSMRL